MLSYDEFLAIIIQRIKEAPQFKERGEFLIEKSLKELRPLPHIFNKETQFSDEEVYVWRYLIENESMGAQDTTQNSDEASIYSFIVLQMTTMVYVHDHKWEAQALFDIDKRKTLIQSITPAYLKNTDPIIRVKIKALKENDNPSLEDLLEIVGFNNAIQLFSRLPDSFTRNSIRTRYPNRFVSPVDKVSNIAFNYAEVKNLMLYDGHPVSILVGKQGSKKEIATMVSINFDEIEKRGVEIFGSKELSMYDREVHDAIATLCVEGENRWITPQMIYQTMTGDPEARLHTKQTEAINNSVTKMMHSYIIIDATREAQAFGFDNFQYDGSLIPAERVTVTLNGNTVVGIHLLRIPPLYEYAERKGQIGRADIKLLNSPLNKTEETAVLQGYLLRRILAIKNPHNKQSNHIVYETIYKQLEISAPNDNALRKKKIDIRKKVKAILDYWKKVGFIKEYEEAIRGQSIYSIIIK